MKWLFGLDNVDLDARESALLARLGAKFDIDPDAFVTASQRPTAKEFELIGTFGRFYMLTRPMET